jgi:tetratricopeptide (TPR) repeat protein
VTRLRSAVAVAAACLAGVSVAAAQGTVTDWPALVRRYETQVSRMPADPLARFSLAMLYARDGRLLDGYKQLQEADRAAGQARRAELVRQIAREAESLIRKNPKDLLARYHLAFARYFMNDPAGAAAEFERIVVLDPRNDWGFGYLGQAYAAAGQEERAIAGWQRGLAVNPNNAVIHYVLGLMYTKRNEKKKAAAHFAAAYRDRTLYEYVTGNRR